MKKETIEELIPRKENGEYMMPQFWEFPWTFDLETAWKETRKLKQHKGESREHWLLKRACILYAGQYWGVDIEAFELEERIREDHRLPRRAHIRPDLTLYLPHRMMNIAFECGTLSYINKIKHLLTNTDFDMVVWLPYPDNEQEHWFVDSDFFHSAVMNRDLGGGYLHPFIMHATTIQICLTPKAEKYYLGYHGINPEWDHKIMRFYQVFSTIWLQTKTREIK